MSQFPPGPRFSMGARIGYMRDPARMFADCRARYGDPFTVKTTMRSVITGNPEGVKQIFTARTENFRPLQVKAQKMVLGDSFTMQSGPEHRSRRALIAPGLRAEALRAMARQMVIAVAARTRTWVPGQKLDLVEEGTAIALEIILRAIFSEDDPEGIEERKGAILGFSKALGDKGFLITSLLGMLSPRIPPQRRFADARAQLKALIQETVEKIRSGGGVQDGLLARMIHAKREDGSIAFSDSEIADNLMTMLVAGHETSALSIGWSLKAVLSNPDVLERLMAELDPIDPFTDPNAVHTLPFLNAVVQETQRLWIPVPDVLRVLAKPLEICGWTIPEGTQVAACVSLTHSDPDIYPDPSVFRPERFLERRYTAYEFYPFGGGERVCIGNSFAPMELKVVLATILKTARLTPESMTFPDEGRVSFLVGPKEPLVATYSGAA